MDGRFGQPQHCSALVRNCARMIDRVRYKRSCLADPSFRVVVTFVYIQERLRLIEPSTFCNFQFLRRLLPRSTSTALVDLMVFGRPLVPESSSSSMPFTRLSSLVLSARVCLSSSPAPSSRRNPSGVPQTPQLPDPPSTGCRLPGFRGHEPACLHDVQHRVYTIMAYGLQRELSASCK